MHWAGGPGAPIRPRTEAGRAPLLRRLVAMGRAPGMACRGAARRAESRHALARRPPPRCSRHAVAFPAHLGRSGGHRRRPTDPQHSTRALQK
eukprot:7701297-Pyramimonas_sp.AAC.1